MVTSYATILPPINAYHRWSFCYLHGEAEALMAEKSDDAPDVFSADMPMPIEEGNYIVSIFGNPAIAVIRKHIGTLSGRVALINDTEALMHVLNEENWR